MKPLLSVCCLGYNHANFLKDNLESIVDINYPNIEVIVVDDGSSDQSVELLTKISEDYPLPIKIIAQENTGNIGKNFNTALAHAKGDLVAFISLDDVFHASVVAYEIQLMADNSALAFVAATTAQSINNEGYINNLMPKLVADKQTNLSIKELLEYEYSHFGAFYIQGTIFRMSLIRAVGGFDEDMTGDDLILRTRLFQYMISENTKQENIWQYKLLDVNNVFYRMHDNNIHKNTLRQLKIVTEYLGKYWADRPNPKSLIGWALYYLEKNPNDIDQLFNLNDRALTLKKEPEIANYVRKLTGQNLSFAEKIYRRIKLADGVRKIIFFNCISFHYQRKFKPESSDGTKIHYKQYDKQSAE